MAGFIGNKPGAKYATLTRQTFSSPTGTSHTLSQTVTNSDDLLLYINNVKQNPADYTASGTTLTTASLAGGTEMYCLYYGKTTETVAVPASSVGDSHIVDMASSKLTGTIADARFPATLPASSGANLTNLPAGNLTGTVADARISALTSSKLTGNLPAISGASLTNLPATGGKYKVLSTTYDISVTGSLAVTGAGFEPKFVYIHYGTGAWVDGRFGWGGSDGTTHKSMNDANKQTSDSWMQSNYLMDNIYASSVYAYITGVTLDSDGVTFTRAKFGTPTGTITLNIFCFG